MICLDDIVEKENIDQKYVAIENSGHFLRIWNANASTIDTE